MAKGQKITLSDIDGGCTYGFLLFMALVIVFAWPFVFLHGNARWVAEGLWLGIPVLLVAAFFIGAFSVRQIKFRNENKLKRVRNKRLKAEGNHPRQIRQREAEHLRQQRLDAEVARINLERERLRQEEERRRQEAEAKQHERQRIRAEIEREKQALKDLKRNR